MPNSPNGFRLFRGREAAELTQKIADYTGREVADALLDTWPNGEIRVQLCENVRGANVFIVQTFKESVNDRLWELLVMIDAARRASAAQITAVIPYFPYGKQEQKFRGREPITARLVADTIVCAGANRVLTVDLHQGAIQGFFTIPVDHLPSQAVMAEELRARGLCGTELVVVAPDSGGVDRAMNLATRLGSSLAVVFKRHPDDSPTEAEAIDVVGALSGKTALILDDMILGGATLITAAEAILHKGAKRVFGCVTHPVLCGDAPQQIADSVIEELIVSDSLPLPANCPDKIKAITLAHLLGDAIERTHSNASISEIIA